MRVAWAADLVVAVDRGGRVLRPVVGSARAVAVILEAAAPREIGDVVTTGATF